MRFSPTFEAFLGFSLHVCITSESMDETGIIMFICQPVSIVISSAVRGHRYFCLFLGYVCWNPYNFDWKMAQAKNGMVISYQFKAPDEL